MQFQNRPNNIPPIQPPIENIPFTDLVGEENTTNNELFIAKLGLFGGLISLVGGIIESYASILAFEELKREQNNNATMENSNKSTEEARIKELEMQVSYLMKEMQKMKNANQKTLHK